MHNIQLTYTEITILNLYSSDKIAKRQPYFSKIAFIRDNDASVN
jgi:hypothetical protein